MDPFLARAILDIGGFVFAAIVVGVICIFLNNLYYYLKHRHDCRRRGIPFDASSKIQGQLKFSVFSALLIGGMLIFIVYMIDSTLSGLGTVSCSRLEIYAGRDC